MPYTNANITDAFLRDGAVSRDAHFRRIRDNTTRIQFLEDVVMSAPATTESRWGLAQIVNRSEVVGKKKRNIFGGHRNVYGNVSRYLWRDQHIAKYHATFAPALPEGHTLIGVEIVGAQVTTSDDESDWTLGGIDASVIGDRIHIFITAGIEGEDVVEGNGRNGGHNTQPIIPINYPDGVNEVPDTPEPPRYSISLKPITVDGGGLDL